MKTCRVLSASCHVNPDAGLIGEKQVDANRRAILECLDRAAEYRPDVVCLPEIALHQGLPWEWSLRLAEPIPGPTFDAVAERARALQSHVVFCLVELDGERRYNTAALIGRDGGLIGVYRKYNATGYEMREGIRPGGDVPVWQTDAGRIGCAICFDLKFPAVGLALSRGRAQLVLWPTMFRGGHRMVSWAMDYGFHLVRCQAGGGTVVDPLGSVIATEGQPVELTNAPATMRATFAEVNTDHRSYHLDFHREKIVAIQREYGAGVTVRVSSDEGTFNLASNLPDATVDDIERRFELKDLRAYLDEADDLRTDILRGDGASA